MFSMTYASYMWEDRETYRQEHYNTSHLHPGSKVIFTALTSWTSIAQFILQNINMHIWPEYL